jgi:hypothetical protein
MDARRVAWRRRGGNPHGREPVPVKGRDIHGRVRFGMPAEEMIVESADLARTVLVEKVVVVGHRQREVAEPESEGKDESAGRGEAGGPTKQHTDEPSAQRLGTPL